MLRLGQPSRNKLIRVIGFPARQFATEPDRKAMSETELGSLALKFNLDYEDRVHRFIAPDGTY